MGRPLLLLPLGVVLALVSLVHGLGAVASHRWGTVVSEQRWCGTAAAGDGLCADRVDVRVDGPFTTRREAGDEWTLAADPALEDGEGQRVDISDDAPLRDRGSTPVTALVEQEERDVVALAVGDTVLPVNDVGSRGVMHRVGLGLLGVSAGTGLVLVALRKRRDSGWTGRGRAVQHYGTAWLALPVLVGFGLFVAARIL